jgi:ADP-ribose pyrophosphatase
MYVEIYPDPYRVVWRFVLDLKPWKTLETRLLLDCPPWLKVVADQVELPDGRVIENYLRLEAPDYSIIVALNGNGEMGLVRSYKHGLGTIDIQPAAGYLEDGEIPLEGAQRELLEELGCQSANWTSLGAFAIGGNRGAGRAHIFLATNCIQVAEPVSGDLEEQEILWLALEDIRARWSAGEFVQLAATAAIGLALYHLDANGAS